MTIAALNVKLAEKDAEIKRLLALDRPRVEKLNRLTIETARLGNEIDDLEIDLDTATQHNAELMVENNALQAKLAELEATVKDDLRVKTAYAYNMACHASIYMGEHEYNNASNALREAILNLEAVVISFPAELKGASS